MIQEFKEESCAEILVDMQPLFDTPFLQKITKEGINEMFDKVVETAVSLRDLARSGDQIHMDKVVETLDKPVEVGIQASDGDQVHTALC